MKLSNWAKLNGISYRTAWNWFKNGKLPVKSIQTESGTIIIQENKELKEINLLNDTIIYGRVSSSNKKQDLLNQIKLCEQYCIANGWSISKTYKEIASGMNDNRKLLNKILENPPAKLVILYKDRLTRFGFNYLNILLKKQGCEIIVINQNDNTQDDLLKDFIAIITSFCCRLYGARRGQSKALKIKETVTSD